MQMLEKKHVFLLSFFENENIVSRISRNTKGAPKERNKRREL